MDIQAQSQGFIGGFIAFMKKANAITVAIGIAVGLAVVQLVNGVMDCFIKPLLALVGGNSGYGSFTIWVFKVGEFIGVLINFVAVMLVLYVLGKLFLKDEPPKA